MLESLAPDTSFALAQAAQVKTEAMAKRMSSKEAHEKQHIEDIAREFEAVFLSEMLKPMFEGIETEGMFKGGKGEEIFRGVMLQEYGKILAEKDVTGIQTQVKNYLLQMQEAQQAEQNLS
ncbi:MAG: chemotaxis protein [Alphaproteobacteria bacterium]|nr:chemotaxis protein [Alphaproteobacteria bacterium]